MKILCFTLFISSLILFSCKKAEDRYCWKSAGNETTLELPVSSFNKLMLHEHLEYVLVQDTIEKLVISGGENLVKFVKADVQDGLLDLSNENKCSFLRSYKKKIKVEIHFKELINIHFEGTEPMSNVGTLEFNWLTFLIRDGSGQVRLNFNAESLHATITHGYGDFVFSGTAKQANLNIKSNGFCDTYGLSIIDSITVISNTQGSINVNVNNAKFKAQIDAGGDIYYKGSPTSLKLNKYGDGELIDAN